MKNIIGGSRATSFDSRISKGRSMFVCLVQFFVAITIAVVATTPTTTATASQTYIGASHLRLQKHNENNSDSKHTILHTQPIEEQNTELFQFDSNHISHTSSRIKNGQQQQSIHYDRLLQTHMEANISDFVPLSCNDNIISSSSSINNDTNIACTTKWTTKFGTTTTFPSRIVIPCGECVVMDLQNDTIFTFMDGIDIIGKLIIPEYENNINLQIMTPLIVVQGELQMYAHSKSINGVPAITINMTGTADSTFYPQNENSKNCGYDQPCMPGTKAIVVAGGKIQVRGIPSDTPTWVNLHDAFLKMTSTADTKMSAIKDVNVLVVSSIVVGTWDVGAEILITSHTLNYKDQSVRRIIKMEPSPNDSTNYHLLYLDEPIVRPSTILSSDGKFAAEVALLSRNIVWQGETTIVANTDVQGGHFMIYHTPNVTQLIEGVEIVNFGQQGNLARYPIHFHFCRSVLGSLVSKNTVRQSNQRCIVIHGTDNLIVEDNIAFDTYGHCFMLEDGIETGNQFIGNLGALTKNQIHVLLFDDTDDFASTYWITNPSNSFSGNVAAGSEATGFWIEPLKRGIRADMYPHLNPDFDPLTLFENNVAHSNAKYGVRTYPKGYHPTKIGDAILDRMKVYRNDGGIFLHDSHRIVVQNSLFADNRHVNVDIDKFTDSFILINTTVVGYTDSFNAIMKSQMNTTADIRQLICYNSDNSLYGIEMHTYQEEPSAAHFFLENVTISGFSNTPCDIPLPFALSDIGNFDMKPFDTFPTLTGINVVDTVDVINLCKESIKNVYINLLSSTLISDADTLSFTDAVRNKTKAILSHQDTMLTFVNPTDCIENLDNCFSTCYDVCFTTNIFHIDAFGTENHRLKVCDSMNLTKCTFFTGSVRYNEASYVSNRDYLANLPSGKFTVVFVDKNNVDTWPNYVSIEYDESICPKNYSRAEITLTIPPVNDTMCTQLIRNPDMEEVDAVNIFVPKYWAQRDYLMITTAVGKGNANSSAVKVVIDDEQIESRKLLLQYIDNRCMKLHLGGWYTLTANIKLVRNTEDQYICNPETNKWCPDIGIATNRGYEVSVAKVTTTLNEYGFQIATGSFQIDTNITSANNVYLFVRSDVSWGMYVDDVTMTYGISSTST